jgi:hypothetical protein
VQEKQVRISYPIISDKKRFVVVFRIGFGGVMFRL